MKPTRDQNRDDHDSPRRGTDRPTFCRRWRLARYSALVSMFLGGVTPAGAQVRAAVATDTVPSVRPMITDVRLDASGTMTGRVVSIFPTTSRNSVVQLRGPRLSVPREAAVDDNGEFEFHELSTGPYQLTCGAASQHLRVWSSDSAPPAAIDQVVVVDSSTAIVRGQQPLCNLFCNEPIMIGVLVAAAIAIPLALHDSGDQANGS